MYSNIFDRLSFLSLFLVIVLLPVFCLPFTNIPIETSKGLLLVLGLMFCLIFWALARFSDGKIVFPRSWLLASGFGVVLVFLLSALFSKNPQVSLFGTMFDIGSFYFIFSGFVLMFMSSIVFQNQKRAKLVLLGTILSSAFVLVFQCLHLFIPKILSLGILADKTSNVFGSWNALGLFAGFSCLMFLLVIEFFPTSRTAKILLEIFILISVLLAICVNYPLVWILLGISSLIIFIYKVLTTLHKEGEEEKKYFPVVSFVVVVISLLFFMSGQLIGNIIPSRLGISNAEVNPSFKTTMSITKEVLVKNPLIGIGPNRFGEAWAMYKPAVINNTQFWDVFFNSGFGLLPTISSTTGALGIFSWLVFLILFLFTGIKSVFSSIKNRANWEMVAFFVLSLYLFISSFLYSAGIVIFLLSLAFAGVFIGLVSNKEVSMSFLNDYRKSFFSILFLILIVICSVAASFKYTERFISVSYFGKALAATTELVAENSIGKALSLYSNDLYLRTYSQIYFMKLNSMIQKGSELSDADKADLQAILDKILKSAETATVYNPFSYLNFQLLGSMYQSVGALGIKGAYGQAVLSYQKASDLNPLNPGLKIAIASSLLADGKIKEAKNYADSALSLKPDYVEALITLSQIAKKEGDNTKALSYAQNALSLAPGDQNIIQYIDSLNNPVSSSFVTTPVKP